MVRVFDYKSIWVQLSAILLLPVPLYVAIPLYFVYPNSSSFAMAWFITGFAFTAEGVFMLRIIANERIELDGDMLRWTEKDGSTKHHVSLSEEGLRLELRSSWLMSGKSSRNSLQTVDLYALKGKADEVRFYRSINGFSELKSILSDRVKDIDPRVSYIFAPEPD